MNPDQPQKSYHHGNLRAELLDTAIEQLRQVGADELSLRALARAIGVSQTAPYRHFADKGELLAAMATRGYRNLLAALDAAVARAGVTRRDRSLSRATPPSSCRHLSNVCQLMPCLRQNSATLPTVTNLVRAAISASFN